MDFPQHQHHGNATVSRPLPQLLVDPDQQWRANLHPLPITVASLGREETSPCMLSYYPLVDYVDYMLASSSRRNPTTQPRQRPSKVVTFPQQPHK